MKKYFLTITLICTTWALYSEAVDIDYPNPDIKAIINKAVKKFDDALVNDDIYGKYQWEKFFKKTFKNKDCFNQIHEGIVVYFFTKPSQRSEIIAIFIEIKDQIPGYYVIADGLDINVIINDVVQTPDAFNAQCLGD